LNLKLRISAVRHCGSSPSLSAIPRIRRFFFLTLLLCWSAADLAQASEEGDFYQYRLCNRVVDLLYDFSGNEQLDQQNLSKHFPGDPEYKKYLYLSRIVGLKAMGAKSVVQPGIMDNVLEVYIAADMTKADCEPNGCSISISYDNGIASDSVDHVKIDRNSLVFSVVPIGWSDATTSLGVALNGNSRSVIVEGVEEKISLLQTGALIPCSADAAAHGCDGDLNSMPQDASERHLTFQTVLFIRDRYRNSKKRKDCAQVYRELEMR
jgi:hypothetical protein